MTNRFIFLLDNRGEPFALSDMTSLQVNVKKGIRGLISKIVPENKMNFSPVFGTHPNQNKFHEMLSPAGHVPLLH